ncbi:ABC transporter permease [Polycladidibacter stylochi]|uniref:ABC transporter permease n=1 Tax=Polycladidibacter stylochi TaxID=1807766 RepID=UPI00082A2EDC|nr:ABC transporter permease [Pseudovibrio stylochi]
MKIIKNKSLQALVLPFLLIALWEFLAQNNLVNTYLLPAPSTIIASAQELIADGVLSHHLLVSLKRVLLGFCISTISAFLLSALHYKFPGLQQFMALITETVRVIPPLALVPALILWFGIGETAKLAVIVLASFFPIYLNCLTALRSVEPRLIEMGVTIRLTAFERTRFIIIPAATPGILTGLRLGFGYSWRALVGAELIAASAGLGYLIIDSEELARTDRVFVGIATIAITGVLLDMLLKRLLSYRTQPKSSGSV